MIVVIIEVGIKFLDIIVLLLTLHLEIFLALGLIPVVDLS